MSDHCRSIVRILLFDLAQRGNRQYDPVWRQRREDQPLDFGIDRESPYFLASRPTFRTAVGNADIDRIVTVRSRVSQAHPTGAPTAADNPLQLCIAFTGRTGPARIVATDIVRKLPSVRHELVPVEVSRVGILETDRPILRRDGCRPDPVTAGLPP